VNNCAPWKLNEGRQRDATRRGLIGGKNLHSNNINYAQKYQPASVLSCLSRVFSKFLKHWNHYANMHTAAVFLCGKRKQNGRHNTAGGSSKQQQWKQLLVSTRISEYIRICVFILCRLFT